MLPRTSFGVLQLLRSACTRTLLSCVHDGNSRNAANVCLTSGNCIVWGTERHIQHSVGNHEWPTQHAQHSRASPRLAGLFETGQAPPTSLLARRQVLTAGSHIQQYRLLLGVVKRDKVVNYQDHNQQQPKRIKLKTPSAVKRRILVAKDGSMWRLPASRKKKRSKKRSIRQREVKGLVPLHSSWTKKLRKMGYTRRWWWSQKS
eukprot:jgi/Chrzof1/14972/Cz09g22210.t1